MQRVGLYVRVSTQEQADRGWSIDAQYAELRKFCDSHEGWKVVRAFKDSGYTAANLDRPGIRNLLECAQRGDLDIVVAWRYDRLSRDNLDFPLLLHLLKKSNVHVVSATEPSADDGSPHGEFVVGLLGLLATLERRTNAVRVKLGMRARAKKGLWHGGTPAYGYRYDSASGRLVTDPEAAATVSLIFLRYSELGNLHALRADLATQGKAGRSGKKWTVTQLRLVLRRDSYRGMVKWGDVVMADSSLRLVDDTTFEACQRLLQEESEKNGCAEVDGTSLKHGHLNKSGLPACPRCDSHQAVCRKGTRSLANGSIRRRYWCRICEAEFDDMTAQIEFPPCPDCRKRASIQYFRQWTSANGIDFRVFGCRACGNRFRVILRDVGKPLGSTTIAAVRSGSGENAATPEAPLLDADY